MDELKLFEIWVNSGEWGGDKTEYIVARTEEEAIEKSHWFKWGKEREYSCHCWEMNGNKLLHNLLLSKYEENKYDVTFEIKLKENNNGNKD